MTSCSTIWYSHSMSKNSMTMEASDVHGFAVGDVITWSGDGKQYKITKRTITAVAIVRYWWYQRLYDLVRRKVGGLFASTHT